jgi:hypothetical protein
MEPPLKRFPFAAAALVALSFAPICRAQAPSAPSVLDQIDADDAAVADVAVKQSALDTSKALQVQTDKALTGSLAQAGPVAKISPDVTTVTIYTLDSKGNVVRTPYPVAAAVPVPTPSPVQPPPPAPAPSPAPTAFNTAKGRAPVGRPERFRTLVSVEVR